MSRTVMVAPNAVRGCWFLESGQRVAQWLPPGLYDTEPGERIDGVDTTVLRDDKGRAFHVAVAVAAAIPGRTLAPTDHN
jgi:hypothetical protein